jgi:hypothetical protein
MRRNHDRFVPGQETVDRLFEEVFAAVAEKDDALGNIKFLGNPFGKGALDTPGEVFGIPTERLEPRGPQRVKASRSRPIIIFVAVQVNRFLCHIRTPFLDDVFAKVSIGSLRNALIHEPSGPKRGLGELLYIFPKGISTRVSACNGRACLTFSATDGIHGIPGFLEEKNNAQAAGLHDLLFPERARPVP